MLINTNNRLIINDIMIRIKSIVKRETHQLTFRDIERKSPAGIPTKEGIQVLLQEKTV